MKGKKTVGVNGMLDWKSRTQYEEKKKKEKLKETFKTK